MDRLMQTEPERLELSIVMPCLNEADTLASCIEKAQRFLSAHGITGEVIVADNGSTDGSQDIARKTGARLVSVGSKGYGSALTGGIVAARGKYLIMGDSDDSYDFTNLSPFLGKLREGYDLVMGNRFKGGIHPGAMPFLNRYLGNPILSAIGQSFFHSPVGDFCCGLRGFTKEAFERLNLQTTGMEFAIEMVVKATLLNMRIIEVPTSLVPAGRKRPPHLRPWRDGWRTLRFLLIYCPRWLFLYPGITLMVVGCFTGFWLLPGPRTIGQVTLNVHTLLSASLAIMVGFQAVSFAAFTKVFAVSEGLLPEDPRLRRLFRILTLEVGLMIGAVLTLLGFSGWVYAVQMWARRSFANLDPDQMLRLVIPASTLLVLGCQTILSSFFLSVLWLRRRRQETPLSVSD